MSVILNEVALKALLETEDGPVGRHVERMAAVVVEAERANVIAYFGKAPSLHGRVDQEVDYEMQGSSAVIGIRDRGNKTRRLAQKEADGTMRFGLRDALQKALAFLGGR